MPAPKVSICIPAYNQPENISRALESIRTQTFTDYEIIVTDDSSNDSVKEMVEKFSFGYKLKYFKNSIALGSPENWNEAIRHASGEYIKILHHDDWLASSHSLATYVKMLDEHPESDIAFCAIKALNTVTNTFWTHCPPEEELQAIKMEPARLFLGNIIGPPSVIMYRRNIEEMYDRNIKYVVDIDFYIRLLLRNPNFQFTKEPLLCSTANADYQVTRECMNKATQLFEYGYLYNKWYDKLFRAKKYRDYFRGIFLVYGVRTVNEFKEAGVEIPQPTDYFEKMLRRINLKRSVLKLFGRK